MTVAIGKVLEKIGVEWTIYNLDLILYLIMSRPKLKWVMIFVKESLALL